MRGEADLSGMALFVRIVEDGSLTAAGRSLGLPKATVSRRLAFLEESLGTPLLSRSTRAVSLTAAGRRFFERVRPIVHDAEAAQTEMTAAKTEPAGLIRVTAPVAFGQAIIAPKLMQFLEKYPLIQADLHFSDSPVNLIAEGFDLAIRMGELEDSELISRRMSDVSMTIVAAPSYLAAFGHPDCVQDLKHHTAILTQKDQDHWQFNGETVRVAWRVSTSSMIVTRDAVRGGLGMALMPAFFVADDLANGTLIRLLPHSEPAEMSATFLYPRSIVPSLAVRTLIDVLSTWCR